MAKLVDEEIKKTMQEVEVPEVVDLAMESGFAKIRELQRDSQMDDPSKVTSIRTYKRRRWSARKMAAMVAVATLTVGGSVFAGAKLYQMHLQKEAAYSASIQIEGSSEAGKLELVDDVEVKVNVIPEGYAPYDKYKIGYMNEEKEAGFYAQESPYLIETEDSATFHSVVDAETLMVGEYEALYIEEKHSVKEGWYYGTVFVLYPEYHRIAEIAAWGHTTKEDLLKFAEGVELVPNGHQVATAELPKWSEHVALANENSGVSSDESEDVQVDEYPSLVWKSDLHLANMMEKVTFETFANDYMNDVTLEASVTDVRFEDNGTDMAAFIDYGDGIHSVIELVKEEERDITKVTATLEITNTTEHDLTNVYFYCPVLMLNDLGDQLEVDWLATGISDSIEYENTFAESGEMDSWAVNGEATVKNYISSLKAGETASVEISWNVDKAQADKLYVVLNGANVFNDKTMKAPIIKLEK